MHGDYNVLDKIDTSKWPVPSPLSTLTIYLIALAASTVVAKVKNSIVDSASPSRMTWKLKKDYPSSLPLPHFWDINFSSPSRMT